MNRRHYINADRVRRHIELLGRHGLTQTEIADRAQVSRDIVNAIVGGQQTVHPDTERNILNIAPPEPGDRTWVDQANCITPRAQQIAANLDMTVLDLFYVRYEDSEGRRMKRRRQAEIAAARSICHGCPVIEPCLDQALGTPEYFGFWAGMTQQELAPLRNKKGTA